MSEQRVLSLTVHRNTLARRRRRLLRQKMLRAAGDVASDPDLAAYVIVAWNGEGACVVTEHAKGIMYQLLPQLCAGATQRHQGLNDTRDLLGGGDE